MTVQRFAVFGALIGLLMLILLAAGPRVADAPTDAVAIRSIEMCGADRQTGIAEIVSGDCAFTKAEDPRALRRGFSDKVGWLRLVLGNDGAQLAVRWLHIGHSRLQSVTLYREDADGTWQATRSGSSIPLADKPVATPDPVFELDLPAGVETTIFVAVDTETAMNLTAALWLPEDYRAVTRNLELIQAGAVGALILTIGFALILFARLRERIYLYFALCQLSVIIMDTSYTGLLVITLWPADMAFDVRIQAASSTATLALFVLFLRSLLGPALRRSAVWVALLLMVGAIILATAYACLVDYGDAVALQAVLGILSVLAAVILSVRMWRSGSRPGGILTVSYSILAVMLLYRQTMAFGLLEPGLVQQIGFAWCFVLVAPTVLGGVLERSEAMRRSAAEARSEALARMRLMAQMSHELRAPLSNIAGFARLLDSRQSRTTPHEAALAISGEARRVLTMVDELLDYARGEVGQLRLQFAPVDLRELFSAVCQSAELQAAERGNTFLLEVDATVPTAIEFDVQRLRQVLDNLIGNAARYTTAGTIRLECSVVGAGDGDRLNLRFVVSDTGKGIAAEDIGRIFEPFFRGRAGLADGGRGAGIGLPLSRQLVGLMGGTIDVESDPGVGSRFTFTVPVRRLPNPEAPAPTVPQRPSVEHLRQLRALIALGAVSDIEAWLAAVTADRPEYAAFHAAATAATRRLDFAALEQLAAEDVAQRHA